MNFEKMKKKANKVVSNEEVYTMVQRIHKKPEDFYDGDIAKRLDAYENYELKSIDIIFSYKF
jgi:gamma-glutamyltranspeptidase